MDQPKILILTLSHGGAHKRASSALRAALLAIQPQATIEVVDALEHCTRWFRAYYDSYLIPLRYWPSLWGWIAGIQSQSQSTGPKWLYRKGARPLFRFIRAFDPDIVIATEVGLCELAALFKRENRPRLPLVAVELRDFNRAWIQPEVDLYLATHEDLASELAAAGAPPAKIVTCGQPIDLAFTCLPEREEARRRLGLERDDPVLLVLFGGAGFGNPSRVLREIARVRRPLQVVFIIGKNPRLEERTRKLCEGHARFRVYGWVNNIQDWMVAADLSVSKPGGETLAEALACGLPMLAVNPLPGNELRTCQWIEKWGVGCWVRRSGELAPTIERLLASRAELEPLRDRARALARPRAAYEAAAAILRL